MSKFQPKGAQFLHLACQGRRLATRFPVSYATGCDPLVSGKKWNGAYKRWQYDQKF